MFLFAQILPQPKTSLGSGYVIALAVIASGIILLKIYNSQNEKKSGTRLPGHAKPVHSTVPSADKPLTQAGTISQIRNEMKKMTQTFGFTPEEEEYFIALCVKNAIKRPIQLVKNTSLLDDLFSRVVSQLNQGHGQTKKPENEKMTIFRIKEKIEAAKRNAKNIKTTRKLSQGQAITLITKKDEQYASYIVNVDDQGFAFPVPRDFFGNELRIPVWSVQTVFFQSPTGQSYRFKARVRRYVSKMNENRILMYHSDSLKALPNRQHERREIRAPANFVHVNVANIVNGKQTEHRFYPNGKELMGTLIDISAGGCSIISPAPRPEGDYIEIKTIIDGTIEDTMIGKIIRCHKESASDDTIMHIRFAKMSRATMNRIFAYIYKYGEKHT